MKRLALILALSLVGCSAVEERAVDAILESNTKALADRAEELPEALQDALWEKITDVADEIRKRRAARAECSPCPSWCPFARANHLHRPGEIVLLPN